MTPSGFDKLSLSIQTCFLWAEGQHLCTVNTAHECKKLYIIYDFFVEISFQKASEDIKSIDVLYYEKDLDPYLENIFLPEDLIM